jgi:hypothetical protein
MPALRWHASRAWRAEAKRARGVERRAATRFARLAAPIRDDLAAKQAALANAAASLDSARTAREGQDGTPHLRTATRLAPHEPGAIARDVGTWTARHKVAVNVELPAPELEL